MTDQIQNHYDAIIIGAGHNGLVCGTYLAQAGKKVLIVEANDRVGGFASAYDFADGFKASVATVLPQLTAELVNDLNLEAHGFSLAAHDLPTIALSPDGNHITISGQELSGVNEENQQAWLEYSRLVDRFRRALKGFFGKVPPRIGSNNIGDTMTFAQFALKVRLLGKEDMNDLLRMVALPARDMMDEFFTDELLKSALSWDYLIGNKLAPRSPNNAVLNLLLRLSGDLHKDADRKTQLNTGQQVLPAGGMAGFCTALEHAFKVAGGEVLLNAPVKKIVLNEYRAAGVKLADGTIISSSTVVSNIDAKTSYLELIGAPNLQVQFAHRIRRNRNRGMVAKLFIALNKAPEFIGLPESNGRLILAPSMDRIEDAFDAAKYGNCPERPVMEIVVPSLTDPSVAPEGKHLLTANVMYVPYQVDGDIEAFRTTLMANITRELETYAPGISANILKAEILLPKDMEEHFHISGGHWHHSELAIDQWLMNRPTYGASQYSGPIKDFYLCGASAHPGGGIMGTAGRNAARKVIKDAQ